MTTLAQRIEVYATLYRNMCGERAEILKLDEQLRNGFEDIESFVFEYNGAVQRHNTYLARMRHHGAELRMLGIDVELDKKAEEIDRLTHEECVAA